MPDDRVRHALLLWTLMNILRNAHGPIPSAEAITLVGEEIDPTPYEREINRGRSPKWETSLRFSSGDTATIGWMSKRGGWSITDAGLEAVATYDTPEALNEERHRRYREIDDRRKRAQESLSEVQQFIANTLQLVEPGTWTSFDDLAELAGSSPGEVADFLASGKTQIPNSYRVLNADGSIPAEGMTHAANRIIDPRQRLKDEGIDFDVLRRASQEQRLNADDLKEFLDAHPPEPPIPATAKRAWMVRGTNVDGHNLVPEWLHEGLVSLSASQLGSLDSGVSYEELKEAVESAYQHKSYAYRGQRLEELDRFLRRMNTGDLVLTPSQGRVYVGEVIGPARFADSAESHSGLRRDVRWFNPEEPIDGGRLGAPVPALLQSQAYIVDLTEAYDQITALVPRESVPEASPEPTRRVLAFSPVTDEFADEILMDAGELAKITDLLWESKQLIFYGPPGTGKTHLARKLARHLTEDGAVKLVQFHPSYTYEDFFEGFRPKTDKGGTLSFELQAGPFRDFAEVATANPSTGYILIIDEINRANLAKVFGELYFLLEYRDESITLQYSPGKEFVLPENLFLIGTMNTADRSIARIDTAMRRRFAFVELDPRIPPIKGLLGRWLTKHELPTEAALLLDELNRRLEDSDASIGPSYLMKESIYARPDGLDRVWQYEIMPLLEDLFYGQQDLEDRYGLSALRKAIAPQP